MQKEALNLEIFFYNKCASFNLNIIHCCYCLSFNGVCCRAILVWVTSYGIHKCSMTFSLGIESIFYM